MLEYYGHGRRKWGRNRGWKSIWEEWRWGGEQNWKGEQTRSPSQASLNLGIGWRRHCQGLIGRLSLVGQGLWFYFFLFLFHSHSLQEHSAFAPFPVSVSLVNSLSAEAYFGLIYCYFVLSHIVVALVHFKREVFHLQNGDTNNHKSRNSESNKQLDHRILAVGFSHCKHYISL